MPKQPTFVETSAAALRERIGTLLDETRRSISAGARFPVGEGTIRVRDSELTKTAGVLCLKSVPKRGREVVAILAREPEWLDREFPDSSESSLTFLDVMRREISDSILNELRTEIWQAVASQFPDLTFSKVLGEVRGTLDAVRSLSPQAAERLETACAEQEGKTLPYCRMLILPMGIAFDALVKAGRMGDTGKLAHARTLMELSELIDRMGYALDKTHTPPAGSITP